MSEYISSFFSRRYALQQDLVSTLASGGSGCNVGWQRLYVSLSKMGVNLHLDDIRNVELSHMTSALARASEAWQRLCERNITVNMLIIALEDASLLRIAEEVKKALNSPVTVREDVSISYGVPSPRPGVMFDLIRFNPTPSLPPAAYKFSSSLPNKRIGDPLDKLEDDACLVVKVSRVDVNEDTKLRDLAFEICGSFKGVAAAKNEANLRLEEEIEAAGGDETKVCNMYTVWTLRAHAATEQRKVKDRSRDVKAKDK
jgi:hypothetical protein